MTNAIKRNVPKAGYVYDLYLLCLINKLAVMAQESRAKQ
jgi:hypothetical protein